MGFDLSTIDGNIGYAKHLFAARGIAPWKECAPAASLPARPASGTLSATLRMGLRHPEVVRLQQLLNKAGFPVASVGAGAPGGETDYFGALTREAVRRFQCAKGIACDGGEDTTGYGRVGPLTRAALNQLGTP